MGLIGELLALPLAPARGTLWVLQRVVDEAERQYYDPSAVRKELAQLTERLEAGEIDETEFDRREDELLARLGHGPVGDVARTDDPTAGTGRTVTS
ncbi:MULTISPECIES: gas vesicle protein GvpG [Streptomyces]|uniref:Gas vesicle protein n=2 Tax=Streptomyces TaxID=1883 RepID=A0A0W7WV81_9ACTN|nr:MULTISPECIES: gas vesicle protein GvpG [Streptomyces]KUF14482.1 gas vesicle protein [Streptomyces silvensis]MVO87257.1 gas vesicle protein [Streptomyces typhae]